jgi:hypothetical protein
MQMLAERTGAMLRHVGLTPDQRVDAEVISECLFLPPVFFWIHGYLYPTLRCDQ